MKKKIIIIIALGILGTLLYSLYKRDTNTRTSEYIFDNSAKITLSDVVRSRKTFQPAQTDANSGTGKLRPEAAAPAAIASMPRGGSTVTVDTLRYFKYLHRRFKTAADTAEHLKAVRAYMLTEMPAADAERLFRIYADYLECEIDLAVEAGSWGNPTDTDSVLDFLFRAQEFRRERLGKEIADALFSAEVKSKEYVVRRSAIIGDETLYGEEKERLITDLNRDMWGEEADAVESIPNPYQRYREKIGMYKRDLAEMGSEEERTAKINEFRTAHFTPEEVQRLKAVDAQIAEEERIESDYHRAEQVLNNRADLSAEEKAAALRSLQDDAFGDQAEAFRRREAIRKGSEKLRASTETEQ